MAALEHTNLHGEVFYKIVFPEFWERAYREKNAYYKRVTERAKKHEAHLRCCIDPEHDSILSYAEKNGGKYARLQISPEKASTDNGARFWRRDSRISSLPLLQQKDREKQSAYGRLRFRLP